jgi:uncharacterized membrane protein HdeD (DUF308 family)
MTTEAINPAHATGSWLKIYAYTRFAFSAVWVAAAFLIAPLNPAIAAVLLVIYPAWDALANYLDARRNGGFGANRSQLINTAASTIAAIAVGYYALNQNMMAVVLIYGLWAAMSGILQLITAVRRWRVGGQWVMALSGVQSTLAGLFFCMSAGTMAAPGIALIAPYAAFGAFYFLVSAIWLTVREMRASR